METASSHQKVSVIIPTYNRANFIENAVISVINQANAETEIIVVDDGSEDNTQKVVNSLQEKYPNLFYYQNERSKGPSGARNTGLLRATGEFIAFLDSDDIWLQDHIHKSLNFFEKHPDIDFLFGNFTVVDFESGRALYNFFEKKKILQLLDAKRSNSEYLILSDDLFSALLQENFINLGNVIIRQSTVGDLLFDEFLWFAEDRDFAIRLFKEKKARFAYRQTPSFLSRTHDANLYVSTGPEVLSQVRQSHLYLYGKYANIYKLDFYEKKLLNSLSAKEYLGLSNDCRMRRNYRKALLSALKSLKCNLSLSAVIAFPLILLSYQFTPEHTQTLARKLKILLQKIKVQ